MTDNERLEICKNYMEKKIRQEFEMKSSTTVFNFIETVNKTVTDNLSNTKDGTKSDRVSCRMFETTKNELSRIAEKQGMTLSDIMTKALIFFTIQYSDCEQRDRDTIERLKNEWLINFEKKSEEHKDMFLAQIEFENQFFNTERFGEPENWNGPYLEPKNTEWKENGTWVKYPIKPKKENTNE